jgi:prepilin-type N-terminal cleavage/methylation domain-containing protein
MFNFILKNKKKGKRGFTLVEMLVAVGILVTSTAGPIFLPAQGIGIADEAKNKILAVYLADEAIEVIKNRRDSNILNGASWLSGFDSCTSTTPCDVDVWTGSISPCVAINGCLISTIPGDNEFETRYGHMGTLTNFGLQRSFYYEAGATANEVKLVVEVKWKQKSVTSNRNIKLENYLYKWN